MDGVRPFVGINKENTRDSVLPSEGGRVSVWSNTSFRALSVALSEVASRIRSADLLNSPTTLPVKSFIPIQEDVPEKRAYSPSIDDREAQRKPSHSFYWLDKHVAKTKREYSDSEDDSYEGKRSRSVALFDRFVATPSPVNPPKGSPVELKPVELKYVAKTKREYSDSEDDSYDAKRK